MSYKWSHMYDIIEQTNNAEVAFDNWMSRDASYARWVEERVQLHQQSIQHNVEIVHNRFKL